MFRTCSEHVPNMFRTYSEESFVFRKQNLPPPAPLLPPLLPNPIRKQNPVHNKKVSRKGSNASQHVCKINVLTPYLCFGWLINYFPIIGRSFREVCSRFLYVFTCVYMYLYVLTCIFICVYMFFNMLLYVLYVFICLHMCLYVFNMFSYRCLKVLYLFV